MKSLIFAGVVALALTSMAQETQAPAVAAPAATTKTAMKKAAKTKKVKKAKPKAQLTTTSAPAMAAAPVEAPAVVAPAAGTSVVTETAAPAPAKKWGASVNVNPAVDYTAPTEVSALTTFGVSYKVTDAWKASLKQTFESVAPESKRKLSAAEAEALTGDDLEARVVEANDRADLDTNNFRAAYTDLVASTSLPAMLGSDAIALSIGTRITNRDATVTRTGSLGSINAHYEANVVVPWTITPKWSTSVLGQYRHYDMQNDGQDRVIALPSVSYAFNDVVSMYQAAGILYSTQKAFELRLRRTRALLETGLDIAPMKGLTVNLNINQDKSIDSSVDEVTDFNIYKPSVASTGQTTLDAVAYEANISFSF
jgi:hypothetical protein